MKEIDLMIFDLDGTLVSSEADLIEAVNFTLKNLGLDVLREQEIINFVGDGVKQLIIRALGVKNVAYYEEAMQVFSEYYGNHLLDNTVLRPSVEEVLINFKNKMKVILTNKRFDFTLAIARGLDLEKHFIEIMGADSMPYMKPDARLVDYLIEKYNVKREKTVIIGDGINDIALARNSKILCCACLNGLGKREILLAERTDYYCEDLKEISSFFC